jgi:hypothetical protein
VSHADGQRSARKLAPAAIKGSILTYRTSFMPTLAERLRDRWLSRGIQVRRGVLPEEIRAFESRNGVALPPDMRDFFLTVDGMEPGHSDEDLLEFLHLGDIMGVSEELAGYRGVPDYGNIVNTLPNADQYFVIADYMCTFYVFAIRLSWDRSDEAPVVLIFGESHTRIAGSFTEIGEKYLGGGANALL